MKTSLKETTVKPEPSTGELLDQIAALANKLKAVERNHGIRILCAVQDVRDRMNGRDF